MYSLYKSHDFVVNQEKYYVLFIRAIHYLLYDPTIGEKIMEERIALSGKYATLIKEIVNKKHVYARVRKEKYCVKMITEEVTYEI
jgi:hypothetical protein|tara:strand:- start:332 stop:586 length:255 start_codon:yes stop_codon:yes gene_type:complete